MNTRRVVVATYNIHRCVGLDRRLDPDRIARVLHALRADVIALQEVDCVARLEEHDQLARLAAQAGMFACANPTLHREHAGYGNALLSRFPILRRRHLDLSVPRREPRAALEVLLDVGSRGLRVIATHLGLRTGERTRQMKQVLDLVDEDRHTPLVLLGDFNEWRPRAAPLRWLAERFGDMPALRTFPTRRPLLALDRIWVRPARMLDEVDVIATPLAREASDHLPVRASLEVA